MLLQRRVLLKHQLCELAQAERAQRPPLRRCAAEVLVKPVRLQPERERRHSNDPASTQSRQKRALARQRACSTRNKMRSNDCNSSAGQFRMKREHRSCSRSSGGDADPGAAWPAAFCACGCWRSARARLHSDQHTPRAPLVPWRRANGEQTPAQRHAVAPSGRRDGARLGTLPGSTLAVAGQGDTRLGGRRVIGSGLLHARATPLCVWRCPPLIRLGDAALTCLGALYARWQAN